MNHVVKTVEIDGKIISFETGVLAKQASGAVIVSSGESQVLVTAVVGESQPRFDFLPLTVDYQDRNGAYGSIPGGFFKREGRQTERETLISRTIDRPIRPLFPKHFRNETQIIATVMSFDKDHETDVMSLCGASAALHISNAPFAEPVAGVRVCRVNGAYVLNPTLAERDAADIDLVVAGTASSITMVEGGGDQVSEEAMLDALDLAHAAIGKIIGAIEELRAAAGVEKMTVAPAPELDADIKAKVMELGVEPLVAALAIPGKHERKDALSAAKAGLKAQLTEGIEDAAEIARIQGEVSGAWSYLLKTHMRATVISDRRRIDGRAPDEIRDIWTKVGISPRAHGSSIFTRGETQAFVTAALGTDQDSQRLEEPSGKSERRFMLHYNFAPFCTGEARPMRGPKRREIGHGALARRAMLPVLPSKEAFPYVMRCTSEILESNGSSSMATVCGSTLAMMDAGVPLSAPVAGIAMGLIKEGDDFAVLSDILGDEDHLGDMDFKVTGTTNGITAFQMDCKIAGVSREVMSQAMEQARVGRLHILGEMGKSLAAPREDLSKYAPRITTVRIKPDKIRDIIGPGGKVIRSIQEQCDVRITVTDDGRVDVASSDPVGTEKAIAMIREITQEAEIGALYVGVVKRIVDFGAFVEIFPGTDGLVHISHLADERVDKVTDVLHEGDEVLVRVIDVDRAGKIRLSRKEALRAAN
ncbi:MAG: polyribonucleotide nucleotidyltransferase [Deltaproteobacteria bacterium]|nr:polyribonucleotide nucleotidyltransferase [Deltaproteobacteria bacterium]